MRLLPRKARPYRAGARGLQSGGPQPHAIHELGVHRHECGDSERARATRGSRGARHEAGRGCAGKELGISRLRGPKAVHLRHRPRLRRERAPERRGIDRALAERSLHAARFDRAVRTIARISRTVRWRSSMSLGISRRMVLRGAGVALALPWLESLVRPVRAQAVTRPKRFVAFY